MAKNPFKKIDYPLEDSKPLRRALEPGKKSGALSVMSPEEFLNSAKRLKDTKEDRLLIDSFKDGMKKGKKFKALKLLESNMADGRHRATAAEELGIEKIPVIDYRDADLKSSVKGCHSVAVKGRKVGKKRGGGLSSHDPNQFMQDVLRLSFNFPPLNQLHYLKEVPKQGYASGGHVLEDDYPTHYLPNVGRQVMAAGGNAAPLPAQAAPAESAPVPAQRFAAVDPSMLMGTSQQPFIGGSAYTDYGGQKIAAPYVTSMRGGYPIHEVAAEQPAEDHHHDFSDILKSIFGMGLFGNIFGQQNYADGGSVEYASPEIERALFAAKEASKNKGPFDEGHAEKESDYLKPLLDMAAAVGTKGATSMMKWPGQIEEAVTQPMRDVVSAGEMATGKKPYDPQEAVELAARLAGTAQTGSMAGAAPEGALRSGLSREAQPRITNALGMHSPGAEAARALPQEKGTVEQILAMLRKQVPESEMQHSGIEEALKGKTHTTREEVAQHFESQLPQLQEKVYGGKPPAIPEPRSISDMFGEYQAPHHLLEGYDDVHSVTGPNKRTSHWIGERPGDGGFDVYSKDFEHLFTADNMDEAKELIGHSLAGTQPTKFKDYSLPGGSNYREVVLHEPGEKSQYTSGHFRDPNYVAHLRMKDYELPEGGKGLLVDELQSDRAQTGRKKGFRPTSERLSTAENEAEQARNSVLEYYRSLPERHRPTEEEIQSDIGRMSEGREPVFINPEGEAKPLIENYIRSYSNLAKMHEGIAPAPYVTSTPQWTDLTLKRALKEAIEGGYDRLFITPGAEQAERYGLHKKVNSIMYSPDTKHLIVIDRRGEKIVDRNISREGMEEMIGKDLSNKLLSTEPAIIGNTSIHSLMGDDLAYGGEGMKSFYDKIVPGRLEKLLRKYDKNAKIEPYKLGTDGETKTVHSVRLTPELRKALQEKGLPAFRKGGKVDNALNLVRKLAGTPA